MIEVEMFKVLTTVALLCFTSVLDAAPLMPGEPFEESSDGNPWKTDATTEINAAHVKLMKVKTWTKFPVGDGKTQATAKKIISPRTSSKTRDKTSDTSPNNPITEQTFISDDNKKTLAATGDLLGSWKFDLTNGILVKSGRFRRSKDADSTGDENDDSAEQGGSHPEAREELVKMLSALEEIHKFINDTRSHRLTTRTRGNSNGRSSGKKNKTFVTDGNLKSTTPTTVDSGGLSPKASTDQIDNKLSGKVFKKTPPSSKKTNKRVCFWKYCSQN